MVNRKDRPVTFNAMVKLFMQKYQIPTRRDLDKLGAKIDRLEKHIRESAASGKRRKPLRRTAVLTTEPRTATDTVLEVIRKSEVGTSFSEIKAETGFPEKKLRNIIFRMSKLGKIQRVERGVYKIA
jgi:hypothetical protein